ncbi:MULTISPECIES: c-type cytochrome, methanol metabolism-related [unclassified Mesorhizobium]|uniref:c-type cytochrome, methanol metabolism-related n=1 Tax=unclassified Mesorhizobium TaxID=325217 RepID=UPI0030151C93
MSVRIVFSALALSLLAVAGTGPAQAQDSKEKAAAVSDDDGKYADADGTPTYKIQDDGTVDWYTFSGYRRFNSDCHVCHGPDGVGSSYAPALADSLKTMDYGTFLSIVAEGRKNVGGGKENVMPAFGDNKNVYCYMDDLYVYLRARAVGDLPRGRPAKKADKPQAAKDHESSCMGG